ncbi:hypothetical protein J6590_070873 [Homalodisca vitripennis]|nr:hypothetical protein J6590_070873 [Homalodisca vitripennis]
MISSVPGNANERVPNAINIRFSFAAHSSLSASFSSSISQGYPRKRSHSFPVTQNKALVTERRPFHTQSGLCHQTINKAGIRLRLKEYRGIRESNYTTEYRRSRQNVTKPLSH